MKIINHSRPSLDEAEVLALSETLRSGHIAAGQEVAEFEKETAEYCHVLGAVACSSGTAALHLALLGLGIGKGMEVILPSFSCACLYQAVIYTGATPVFADCHPKIFLITADTIKVKISKRTRAIIVPHMFGLPADMDEIMNLGLPVLEDITQALGATYKGRKTGGLSEIAATSFYATKMMTTGTGGMVLSNDRKLLERVRDLNGIDKKKDLNLHFPYLMNDMQASLGRCQIKKIKGFISKRRKLALHLNTALRTLPVELPKNLPLREHIYFRYCLKINKPIEPVVEFLHQNGVRAQRPIFYPLHLLDQKNQIHIRKNFVGTQESWMKTISLPIYPGLNHKEIEREVFFLEKALKS